MSRRASRRGGLFSGLLGQRPDRVALSAVVYYELQVGLAKSKAPAKRRRQVEALKNALVFLPFHEKEAVQAAQLRAELEKLGTPIGPYDTMIAATALANSATLVTHNTREFSRAPGLQLTDWY